VFLPIFKRLCGVQCELKLVRRGFYPKGGGIVELLTTPVSGALPAFSLVERGKVTTIRGLSIVAG
jgi:RNA 3'-terminal phosphate cyclase (ATP)